MEIDIFHNYSHSRMKYAIEAVSVAVETNTYGETIERMV